MQTETERAVDTSPWSGNAAMTSAKSAADYASICAGRKSGDPSLRSTWALPHHKAPGSPPNADGVRAALQRFSQTEGLTNAAEARAHLERHMAEIRGGSDRAMPERPTDIVRALPDVELEAPPGDGTIGTLLGYLARFGEWTEIDSVVEGHFVESVAAGSFAQTIERDRGRYQPLYEHGKDPTVSRKPLGPIRELREDDRGAFYRVGLLDTDYNRNLLPAAKAGLFGSSFRGSVESDSVDEFPERSDHNPDALPEVTLERIRLTDFGPCPFPAYIGTTTTARSMTDEYLMAAFTRGEGLERLAEYAKQARPIEVRSTATEDPPTDEASSDTGTDDTQRTTPTEDRPPVDEPPGTDDSEGGEMDPQNKYRNRDDLVQREGEISQRQQEIARDHPAGGMSDEAKAEWDALKTEAEDVARWKAERDELDRVAKAAVGESNGGDTARVSSGVAQFQAVRQVDRDIYDPVARRNEARTIDEERRLARSDAMRALELAEFPHVDEPDAARHAVARTLARIKDPNQTLVQRILNTGSPTYKRAFGKALAHAPLTNDEVNALSRASELERALSLTGASGGFAVPFELDPTIIPTSNGTVNPLRRIASVETISVDEWRGVSSGAVTAAYAAEATETTDNAPTLAQPTISTEKAQAFIPFSIEIGMDWDGLQASMAQLLQEAKDDLEADKFVNGTGTNEPFGLLTGVTNTVNAGAGGTFTIAHLYSLIEALPPRYQPNAQFAATLAIYDKVRQFDTAGGAGLWMYLREGIATQRGGNTGAVLLDRAANIASAMPTATTVGLKFLVFGDFSRFKIVDRVGLNVETIQHLVGTNHRPTGQRGLYAYWRNSSKVVDANGFRALLGVA